MSTTTASTTSVFLLKKGGFWIRALSWWVDGLIWGIPAGVAQYTLGAMRPSPLWVFVLWLGVPAVYFAYFWSVGGGQSPGMRLLKLRVVRTDGSPLSLPVAILRFICLPFNFLLWGIPIIFWVLDPNKQGLHDRLAGTYVIKVR